MSKSNKSDNDRTTVSVDLDTYEKIKTYCEKKGLKISQFVTKAAMDIVVTEIQLGNIEQCLCCWGVIGYNPHDNRYNCPHCNKDFHPDEIMERKKKLL